MRSALPGGLLYCRAHRVADPFEQHANLAPVCGGVERRKPVCIEASDFGGPQMGAGNLGAQCAPAQ